MKNDPSLPNVREPVFPGGQPPTQAYRKFFERLSRLAADSADAGLQAQIDALAAQVAALEQSGGGVAMLLNGGGIAITGLLTDPFVVIALDALLSELKDVSSDAPAEGDRLTWDAALALWKPAADPPASPAILPLVTGEIDSGQPVFVYADDGSLIYTEIA